MAQINIKGFTIEHIDPDGTFEIINKTKRLPATKVELTFHLEINFMIYISEEGEPVSFDDNDPILEEVNMQGLEII